MYVNLREGGEASTTVAMDMDMDIEKDARPPAKQGNRPRHAMELDAIASAVRAGGPRSAGKASPATGLFRVSYGPVVGFVFTCGIIFSLWLAITDKDPIYTVAIAAVSGLDPATDIGRRPALDPEFNLTVGIVPRRALHRQCDELSTSAKVAYHGYELASAAAPQLCVLGGERMSTTVVARGARVRLPGPVLDSLAADVRRAAGLFDVTLAIRAGHRAAHGGDGLLVSCMGRRVGDDDAGDLCDVAVLHPRAH